MGEKWENKNVITFPPGRTKSQNKELVLFK